MSDFYILNNKGQPVLEPCIEKWAAWFETSDRTVRKTQIGASKISTVFLGLDHGFDAQKRTLWETMVFGGDLDQEQYRCSGSREQAEAMHAQVVKRVVLIAALRAKIFLTKNHH